MTSIQYIYVLFTLCKDEEPPFIFELSIMISSFQLFLSEALI